MTTKKKKRDIYSRSTEAVMYVWRPMGTIDQIAFMIESWLHRYKGFEWLIRGSWESPVVQQLPASSSKYGCASNLTNPTNSNNGLVFIGGLGWDFFKCLRCFGFSLEFFINRWTWTNTAFLHICVYCFY